MSQNRARLDGTLVEPVTLRTTPTGRLVAHLVVEHESEAADLDPPQRLALRLTVVAVGGLAERCRDLHPGDRVVADGRLNQRRWIRNGQTRWGQMELVALGLTRTAAAHNDDTQAEG